MKIHELKKTRLDVKKLRVGRGISAGKGKTAGRGTKGQKSRSGHNIPRKFEGGQTPLNMRLHKLPGFKRFTKDKKIITLSDISRNFKDGETVSNETLESKGLIRKGDSVKVLANGELTVNVIFSNVRISKNVELKLSPQNKNSK